MRQVDPVADPWLGDEQVGQRALRIERRHFATDLRDVDVQVVVLLVVCLTPYRAQQAAGPVPAAAA